MIHLSTWYQVLELKSVVRPAVACLFDRLSACVSTRQRGNELICNTVLSSRKVELQHHYTNYVDNSNYSEILVFLVQFCRLYIHSINFSILGILVAPDWCSTHVKCLIILLRKALHFTSEGYVGDSYFIQRRMKRLRPNVYTHSPGEWKSHR